MSDPSITICGALGDDPTLRYTAAGKAVCSGRIAHTPKTKDRDTGAWVDGETLWLSFSLWGPQAEHLVSSVRKGDRLVIAGRLKARRFLRQGGAKRVETEIDAEEIGVSTKFNEAHPQRAERRPQRAAEDPWGSAPADGYLPNDAAPF